MLHIEVLEGLDAAKEAVERAVPRIVTRHRCAGTLTWALLHRIEDEVLAELKASDAHLSSTLGMIRSSPLLGYPMDDRPASFRRESIVPIIFEEIERARRFVH